MKNTHYDRIRKLLRQNTSQGYSNLLDRHFCYIKPSTKTYPFQFFWDTCFHVFMLVRLKEYELAKKNMISLFALQEEDGFVGHMIFWEQLLPKRYSDVLQARPTWRNIRPHMSSLVQPSFVAQAVLRIYEETEDLNFLIDMLPKLKKYHIWLKRNRDFEGEGLLSIISPFESGMDWKPSFDEVLNFEGSKANRVLFFKAIYVDFRNFIRRYDLEKIYKDNYFIVKEVWYNTIYVLDLYALASLCKVVNDPFGKQLIGQAKKTTQKILEVMYDEKDKAFYDVYGKDFDMLRVKTPTIFFPINLPDIPKNIYHDLLMEHFFNKKEFFLPFPIPSVSALEKKFMRGETIYLWRGPTWVVFNWFLYKCMARRNYLKEASLLKNTVESLIEKSGFREYYDPFTGEGFGAKNFTWSGLIVDMV